MFYLEASARIFKAHLFSYTLTIYVHIELKAGFLTHAITRRTEAVKHPQDAPVCL